jgi:hypothetical protein
VLSLMVIVSSGPGIIAPDNAITIDDNNMVNSGNMLFLFLLLMLISVIQIIKPSFYRPIKT